jgi:phosphate-selective porin OprO/OprP
MTKLARRTLRPLGLAMLLCGVAPAALAQQAVPTAGAPAVGISQEQLLALVGRLDALEQRNEELEAQILDLKGAQSGGDQALRTEINALPKVSLSNGRPQFATADGAYKFSLRGVAQFDAADYHVSPLRTDNDLQTGTNFRRARLGFDGTALKDWNFALWAEFGGTGGESAVLNQAFLEYAGFKPFGPDVEFRIRGGAWTTPAGLEDGTSNTENLFLERAASAELVRGIAGGDGRTGVGIFANGQRWYGSAVWTGKTIGVPATAEFDQQSGYIVRAAFNPLHGLDYDVHLGGAITGVFTLADTAAGVTKTQQTRLRERPEIRVDGTRLIDTGAVNAKGLTTYGLEAGASYKAFYVAGEWFQIDVDRSTVGAAASPFDPSFSGWYVQGAYALTGERRVWNAANGGFRGIRPDKPFNPKNSTWGAWELGARYSVLDLNDREGVAGRAAPVGGIRGGEQKITTVGLNWCPNNVVRFLLDYQWVDVERLNAAGGDIGTDVNIVSLRTQVAF